MFTNSKFHNLVEAIVYIAMHAKPNAVRGPEICKAQNLPLRYLENSLQQLVHDGILRSVRGPKGGYVLAKERRNISLADIYSSFARGDDAAVKSHLTALLANAEQKYLEELAKISIESLCNSAGQNDKKQKADSTI